MSVRSWVFTLNNPEGDLNTNVDDLRWVIWQLEQGENGTYHFQGHAQFSATKRLAAVKRWLPRAHWEPRRGTAEQANAYASKQDTRIAGPWQWGTPSPGQGARIDLDSFRTAVEGGHSDAQLLEEHLGVMAKYPRLASTIRRARAQRAYQPVTITAPTDWQKIALEIADQEPSVRKVHWFVDKDGNGGKTFLCRHLITNKQAFYSIGGKHADILYAYEGENVVCFDFPRSAEDFVCYSVIEALKNGVVTVSKYESRTFMFPIPTVLVFSNFAPDRTKLSADRWDIHHINVHL